MKHLAVLTLGLILFLSSSALAYVSGQRLAPSFKQGAFDFHYIGEYFTSDENIGDYGDIDPIANDGEYNEFVNYVEGGHIFKNIPLRAFGTAKLTFANVTKQDPNTFNLTDKDSSTDFNSIGVGAQYFFKLPTVLIIPEVMYDYSFDEYQFQQTEIISSDLSDAIQIGAYVASFIWKFKSEAYLGYRHHTDTLADNLLYSWRLAFRLPKFSVAGRLSGGLSMTEDADSDTFAGQGRVDRSTTLSFANGGSLRHHSINPQWLDASLEAAFNFDKKARLIAGLKQTLTGENTGYGMTLYVGINAAFGNLTTDNTEAAREIQDPEFEADLEEYDKSIFEEPKKKQ